MGNLEEIRERIKNAALRSGHDPKSIRLIAVSKGQSIEKISEIFAKGQKEFGENYAQELIEKSDLLRTENIDWHFIGHLQTNKVGKIIDRIEWLHSLDSLKLAETIDQKSKTPLKCLLEINFGNEKNKTGLSKEKTLELIPKLNELSNIDLRGLMTMSPHSHFRECMLLLQEINESRLYRKTLTELSMGMSDDFEIAIEKGATMVRVGTAIFGERE